MLAVTVFLQMLSFVIMIGAGMAAAKMNLLDETANQRMSALVLKLFGPMLSISSAACAAGNISLKSFGLTSLTALGMFGVYILIAAVSARLFNRDKEQQKLFGNLFMLSAGMVGIVFLLTLTGILSMIG